MKRFIIIFSILYGFMSAMAVNPESEEDPYFLLMGEAEKAISEENYEEAAARLIDALAVNPSNPSNLLVKSNLGMVYSCLDRDSTALATLDEVLEQAPKMTAAMMNRAKVYLKLNNNEKAYADFSKVTELDSTNVDARYFRGMMALYGGKLDIAESDFNVLEKRQPDKRRTYDAMSALYALSGRNLEAVKYFKKLIDIEPAPEYFSGLAGCYLAMGELSEASATIADGMKRYPTDPELFYYRAWLNRDRYLSDDARRDARQAIKYGASPSKVNALFHDREMRK